MELCKKKNHYEEIRNEYLNLEKNNVNFKLAKKICLRKKTRKVMKKTEETSRMNP